MRCGLFGHGVLILLRHKFLGDRPRMGAAQHGHRNSVLASATINLRRIVAIEFGTWRSVRNGGTSGSVTVGKGKFFEQRGGTRSTGGNRLPLGDQEAVGCDAQRGMVVEAAPTPAFEMPEPNLLFEFLVIALYLAFNTSGRCHVRQNG